MASSSSSNPSGGFCGSCCMYTAGLCRWFGAVGKYKRLRGTSASEPEDHSWHGNHQPRGELDGASNDSSLQGSPPGERRITTEPVRASSDWDDSLFLDKDDDEPAVPNAEEWTVWLESHHKLSQEMEETKETLIRLQQLLLEGQGQEDPSLPSLASSLDSRMLYRSKASSNGIAAQRIKEELYQVKAEKTLLQQRLLNRYEQTGLSLTSDLPQPESTEKSLKNENGDVEKLNNILKQEVSSKDQELHGLKNRLRLEQEERRNEMREMKEQITEMQNRMKTNNPENWVLRANNQSEPEESNDPTKHNGNNKDDDVTTFNDPVTKQQLQNYVTYSPQPAFTKVLYFIDNNVNPCTCIISKRIGDIALKDFKDMLEYRGNQRYRFKAMDPDYGSIKQELSDNEDLIPGWEGKVIAWVDEDHG